MIKKIFFYILAVVVPFLVCLGALEAGLRIFPVEVPEMVTRKHYQGVNRLYLPNSEAAWYGSLGNRVEFKNIVRTNRIAYHDANYAYEKPDGFKRIMVVGDSFVEAFQIPLEKTFHKILERALRQHNPKTEVIALGNSGHGMLKNYIKLNQLGMRFRPDMVIAFMTLENDFSDDWHHYRNSVQSNQNNKKAPALKTGTLEDPINFKIDLYEKIHVFKFSLLNRFLAYKTAEVIWRFKTKDTRKNALLDKMIYFAQPGTDLYAENESKIKEGLNITLGMIVKMQELCDANGIPFMLVLQDRRMSLDKRSQNQFNRSMQNQSGQIDIEKGALFIRKFLESRGVDVLDLHENFVRHYHQTGKTGHWDESGHQITATTLHPKIQKALK